MADKVKGTVDGYGPALARTAVAVAAAHVYFGLMAKGYAPWMDVRLF